MNHFDIIIGVITALVAGVVHFVRQLRFDRDDDGGYVLEPMPEPKRCAYCRMSVIPTELKCTHCGAPND